MTSLFIVQEIHDICDKMMEEEIYRDPPQSMLDIQNLDVDDLESLEHGGMRQEVILSYYDAFLTQLVADASIDPMEYNRLIDLYNDSNDNACRYHDEQIVQRGMLDDDDMMVDPTDYDSPFGDIGDSDDGLYQVDYGPDDDDIYGNQELDSGDIELPDVTATLCGKAFLLP